jgi:hypothetical protein
VNARARRSSSFWPRLRRCDDFATLRNLGYEVVYLKAAAASAREVLSASFVRVASSLHIPLLDYHAALASLPNAGLSDDNIHPSAYVENGDTRAGVFTPAGLRNGYNVRNLTLLLMLERLIETVGARA